jgi:hypothetical protein
VALGWAYLDGEELFNEARTAAYVRAGLAGPYLTVSEAGCCDALSKSLTGAQQTYVSPAADPAPWYDPGHPASAEFLGFLVKITGTDSTLQRTVTPKTVGRGGGALGRLRPAERNIVVTGHLVASTQRGQEYGMRWLTARLATALGCDTCAVSELRVMTHCPEEAEPLASARWIFRDVGVLEGPRYPEDAGGLQCAELRPFDLTLVSEQPYMYQPASVKLAETVFPIPSGGCRPFCSWFSTEYALCASLGDVPFPDDYASVITVKAGTQAATFTVRVYDTSSCPPGTSDAPRVEIPVAGLPAGHTLFIDSASEAIYVTRADGVVEDGFPYLNLDTYTPFDWATLGCDALSCVCVEATECGLNYQTSVAISAVRRRL